MYKKIIIVTITLLLFVSGCVSPDEIQNELQNKIAEDSEGNKEKVTSVSSNSLPENPSENESRENVTTEQIPKIQIVVPPHTATEIVYQDQVNGNYLLLNTTEHTYFVNQTEDDFGGTYTETSETYNLNTDFGTTNVNVKGDNCIIFDAKDGKKGVWERV